MCGLFPAVVATEQTELASGTMLLTLRCPEVARMIRPGQFVMFRDEQNSDPLLGRPFALYDTEPADSPEWFQIAYHVIGKQTSLMVDWEEGRSLRLWGPLGNGFPGDLRGSRLTFVGGGIGYSPFPAVFRDAVGVREYGKRQVARRFEAVDLIQGARAADLMTREEFSAEEMGAGLNVERCTDDGSFGRRGRVTDLLSERLADERRPSHVFACGPVPMMVAVAEVCRDAGIPCWLSLETPMACGFGACFSCVVPVRDDASESGWDYRRSCVDGPVFDATTLDLAKL